MSQHDEAAAPQGAAADEPIRPELVEDGDPGADGAGGPAGFAAGISVEDLIEQLEQVTAERDGHFEARARLQAEFDNYRKRVAVQQGEQIERAAEGLITKLLPVLDACDAAVAHDVAGAGPIAAQLSAVLEREGLERLAPVDQPFDPAFHEAVLHEAGDGGPATVADVLRTGYLWKQRVIRPAMVKVRG